MKITERDIELMGWILEQKFMTERQVRQVFWKGTTKKSRHTYKRLKELEKVGYLKTNKTGVFQDAVYMVRGEGVRQVRAFNQDQGLGELGDVGYSNYRHDLVVTDIRIMFHGLGYRQWLSERVLSRRSDLRRIPDGMVFNNDRRLVVEYELSQKSKRRYRNIFYNYELDNHVKKVLYIVNTPELIEKVFREASGCTKLHFVCLEDLKRGLIHARLKSVSGDPFFTEIF